MLTIRRAFDDPIRQRCIRALSHPLTLAAVIVLLVNDHILRVYWPSWITGKLGDFAWLAFFPLTLAAPLAWIIPTRFTSRRLIIPALAFGLTAALFISMKTIPAALDAGLWVLREIVGGPFFLILDPTDLLTLPGLAVGLWVWWQSEHPARASRGWVVLALGALATIATSPPAPSPLVDCLIQTDDGDVYAIVAVSNDVYSTFDGGLTWSLDNQNGAASATTLKKEDPCDNEQYWQSGEIIIKLPTGQGEAIRVTSDRAERTTDGGRTWVQELNLAHTDAEVQYFDQTHSRNYFLQPYDALVDTKTGNLIVAMGIEGVLVRTPRGVWERVAVGEFRPMEKVDNIGAVSSLLGGHLALACVLFMLVAATINIWSRFHHWLLIPVYALAWLLWIFILGALAGGSGSYAGTFLVFIAPAEFVLFLIILTHAMMTKVPGREPKRVKWVAGGVAIPLFLLPYIFWTQGIIPTYSTATMFSLTLIACVLFGAILESHPVPPPEPAEGTKS